MLKSFRQIKEKYGFQNLYNNLKIGLCGLLESLNFLAKDACKGYIDNYGAIIIENFFSKYLESYFLCEIIYLCPTQKPKKYINPDIYAQKLLNGIIKKKKEIVKEKGKTLKILHII